MISEKTVELNLTTEFINWLSYLNKTPYFAVGPTQAQEAQWGFDAGIFGSSSGALIQYKRAYVNGTIWEWRLNRTKKQDQLERLQLLEAAGYPVFYAFPFFHTLAEVQIHRRRLLVQTFWYKPSQLNPIGGPNGHHEVRFDQGSGKWTINSEEPVELPPPIELSAVISAIDNSENRLSSLAEAFNRVVLGDSPQSEAVSARQDDNADTDLLRGVCLIGRGDA